MGPAVAPPVIDMNSNPKAAPGAGPQHLRHGVTTEVVLCTYNGEKYLGEQLQSILAQTRPVDRISLYDDGSSDGTISMAQDFIGIAARHGVEMIVARNASNLGYARNFAQGLRNATRDWVFLCDQDDVWEADKVAELMAAATSQDCAMVFSDGCLIDQSGEPMGTETVLQSYGLTQRSMASFADQSWQMLLRRNYINGAAMVVRRSAAQEALPVAEGFPHDYWLALSLAARYRIACISKTLYRYRQHATNTIGIGAASLPRHLLSIWRNPLPPRQLDLRRSRTLLEHGLLAPARRAEVEEKCRWLAVAAEPHGRGARIGNIVRGLRRGYYRRFSPPYSLMRDVVAALRGL